MRDLLVGQDIAQGDDLAVIQIDRVGVDAVIDKTERASDLQSSTRRRAPQDMRSVLLRVESGDSAKLCSCGDARIGKQPTAMQSASADIIRLS